MAKARRTQRVARTGSVSQPLAQLWGFIVWVTGVLVSLAVGFGMIGRNGVPVLRIWYVPDIVTVTAGWIVVILAVLGAVLKLIDLANQ